MAFFHRRSAPTDARFLEWKVRLFTIGAVLALAGMYLELGWMVGVAIGFLVAGFALRFVPNEPSGGEVEDEWDEAPRRERAPGDEEGPPPT
jgi:hypothetical protein